MTLNIGIVDDHQLFLKSLSVLIESFPMFEIVIEALNEESLLAKLASTKTLPDIILLDVNMPVMDGVKTASAISEKYPLIKSIALSMKDDDTSVINMIRAGCCAYLLKDIHPDELEKALTEVHANGYYNADVFNINYRRSNPKSTDGDIFFTESKISFFKICLQRSHLWTNFCKDACIRKDYRRIQGSSF